MHFWQPCWKVIIQSQKKFWSKSENKKILFLSWKKLSSTISSRELGSSFDNDVLISWAKSKRFSSKFSNDIEAKRRQRTPSSDSSRRHLEVYLDGTERKIRQKCDRFCVKVQKTYRVLLIKNKYHRKILPNSLKAVLTTMRKRFSRNTDDFLTEALKDL